MTLQYVSYRDKHILHIINLQLIPLQVYTIRCRPARDAEHETSKRRAAPAHARARDDVDDDDNAEISRV